MFRRYAQALLLVTSVLISSLFANEQLQAQDSTKQSLKHLVANLGSRDVDVRVSAAIGLLEYKDQVNEFAVPLSGLLVERDEILNAAGKRVFKQLGLPAVSALSPDFDSADISSVHKFCSAINAVGDPCEEYKSNLVEMLIDETDMNRRLAATFALTGFSEGCPEAIDHILKDLQHQDMNVKLFAARLIIKTGKKAKQAIPALANLLETGITSERSFAVWALAAIGPTDEFDVLDAIRKQLARFNVVERERGLIAAGLLGEAAKDMEPKVREMMAEDYSNLEGPGAVALWKITGDATDSIARLIQVTKDFSEYEVNGPKFLGELGPDAAPAAGFLVERLASSDSSVHIAVLESLGKIGPAAADQKEKVAAFLEGTESPLVRFIGNETLELISSEK